MSNAVVDALWQQATTDTGRVLVDSGDHYGRQWKSNLKNGRAEKMCSYRVEDRWIGVKINTVLYLAERLKLPKKNNSYRMAKKVVDLINEYGYHKAAPYIEDYLRKPTEHGDPRRDIGITDRVYTYNRESDLDQLVQFFCVEVGERLYIAVQLHNGCDARWGLPDAMLYEADGEFAYMLETESYSEVPKSLLVQLYLPDDGRICLDDGDNQWYREDFSSDFKNWRLEYGDGANLSDYEYVTDGTVVPGKLCLKDGVLYSPLNSKPMEAYYAGS